MRTLAKRKPLPDFTGRLGFNPSEVGLLIGRSRSLVLKEIELGHLPAKRVGGGQERSSWLITKSDLEAYLATK